LYTNFSEYISDYVHELDDVTPGKLTENTQVDKLPESVRSLLCVHLNADNAFGDNWERYRFMLLIMVLECRKRFC
jgi:hypothetical protein